ncbi:hypothetical protein BDR26DRAFT_853147 [Obelidium mucronatum]|nr:hypothetical protein BDR26DRAFT_853147 [Obelidium mucronatum]
MSLRDVGTPSKNPIACSILPGEVFQQIIAWLPPQEAPLYKLCSHQTNIQLSQKSFIKLNILRFVDSQKLRQFKDGPEALDRLWFQSFPLLYQQIYANSLNELKHTEIYWRKQKLNGSIPYSLGDTLITVTCLDLSHNNLHGEVPPSLGNLLNLKHLYLNGNSLSGPIPIQLGLLQNLITLNLHRNQLSGTIPFQLGNAQSLRFLYLDHNCLSGQIPRELGIRLVSLVEVSFDSNSDLEGDIPVEFSRLEFEVNVDGTRLTCFECDGASLWEAPI